MPMSSLRRGSPVIYTICDQIYRLPSAVLVDLCRVSQWAFLHLLDGIHCDAMTLLPSVESCVTNPPPFFFTGASLVLSSRYFITN